MIKITHSMYVDAWDVSFVSSGFGVVTIGLKSGVELKTEYEYGGKYEYDYITGENKTESVSDLRRKLEWTKTELTRIVELIKQEKKLNNINPVGNENEQFMNGL